MTFVILLTAPCCRERFSALSDAPLPTVCPVCHTEWSDATYAALRYRAGVVARELETGTRVKAEVTS